MNDGRGSWVIHHVDVMVGDDHITVMEAIGDHDAETDTFAMHAFDGAGSYSTMRARLNGDGSWTFTGGAMRSRLQLGADGSAMAALWERETGDEPSKWIRWMDMRFTRQG